MTDQLPAFIRRDRDDVFELMRGLLTNPFQQPPTSHLKAVIPYDDGHFRVLFDPAYFILAAGADAPSKSQWNTLKKRLKRHEPTLFIFKQHGTQGAALYLDIGFVAKRSEP